MQAPLCRLLAFSHHHKQIAQDLSAGLIAYLSSLMEFINPPPFGVTRDLSNSPTYDEGTTVNIACTSGEKGVGVSLCLYQPNETDGKWFGDIEYLTRMQDTCSKNLTLSKLFYLSIFQEGKGSSDSNSHYFYIAEKGIGESSSPSFLSSAFSSTSIPQAISTVAPTLIPTSSSMQNLRTSTGVVGLPTSDATDSQTLPDQQSSSDSFPLAVKIGLGTGIPVALALRLVIGWLLFRHRKRRDTAPPYGLHEIPAGQNMQYKHYNNEGYYVEIGQLYPQDFDGRVVTSPNKPAATPHHAPVRFEM
ncbi:hypothetical protein COCVIDRAFT_37464 [Bipolaris victoriae FI3]|uniref:Uncharacterized protein n=1 Tax=Bipolaris victoriae (strain FI3) TaxID=930091 RepID=W7EK85_BIPV3|nr:hypothetical protein COCVIDRAFT_37464 [Bipolaris victoriae FI3]